MRALALVAVLAAGAAHAGRESRLVIPQVGAPIVCDGELDEIAWRSPARTGPFVDDRGGQAAPYSDARLLRDDKFLYLALYAADEDIRSSDEFVVELGRKTWHFTAGGVMSPAGTIRVDVDGTVDEPSNDDEEWVVEAAVPLVEVPFGRDGSVTARIVRCDVTKDRVKRCGSWKGVIVRR